VTLGRREERIANNETRFRDINERLEQGLRHVRHAPELLEFVCECGDRECEALIRLTLDEYEDVRRDSRRFAVVPGHVFPQTERVIGGNERYQLIEKFGEAVDITDAADHRAAGEPGGRRAAEDDG
jgi:hypothetical protein